MSKYRKIGFLGMKFIVWVMDVGLSKRYSRILVFEEEGVYFEEGICL